MTIKKYFITGTDTSIGKTFVSSVLLRKASSIGYHTAGYKPVASSHSHQTYNLKNKDAIILQKNSSVSLRYREVNPITFYENSPPHILSDLSGEIIDKKKLSRGLNQLTKKANWILIEGAGGWYTPISYTHTFSDWVKEEKLEVILIVGIKLGCINHAILTEKAIMTENIKCVGWVANNILPRDKYNWEYIKTLLGYIKSPLLGIVPYLKNKNTFDINKTNIQLPE